MYCYSIFQHLFKFIPRYRFEKSVEKHSGDRYCKHFTAIRQLKTILYADLQVSPPTPMPPNSMPCSYDPARSLTSPRNASSRRKGKAFSPRYDIMLRLRA